MKVVICAIAKKENLYINDWAKYHLELGFDDIYVYDNNDSDYDSVKNYIEESIKDKVHFIDAKDKRTYQVEAYNTFYSNYEFDWCAFIDIDEFINLKKGQNIKDFLSNEKFKNVDSVILNWKVYGDNDLIERDTNIPVWESFTKVSEKYLKNRGFFHVKNIVSSKNKKQKFFRSVHVISCPSSFILNYVDAYGNPINAKYEFLIKREDASDEYYIAHYKTKSLSEFINQKLDRTDAFFRNTNLVFNYYLEVNDLTPEKIEYLKNNNIEYE